MSATVYEVAARGVGNIRLGRYAVPGQGRVVDFLGKMTARMNGNFVTATPWSGVNFEVDLADRIQRQMWAGNYEPHVRRCFEALLQAGDVYLDVGGHIGYHATAAAHRVGPNGHVTAFEADPGMHQRLSRNLKQFPWAQAVHAAVWSSSGTLRFERSSNELESGWGTLTDVRDLGTGEHVDVPAIALDDYFRDSGLTRWNAMKLDAEGSEPAVLRGAEKSIKQFRPFLILEINGSLLDQAGLSSNDVVELLTARDYGIYLLSYRQLERLDKAKRVEFSEAICLPREQEDAYLQRLVQKGFSCPAK